MTIGTQTAPESDAGLQGGSLAAYERLFHEQGARMKSLAANLLADRAEAEDAVQEAFLKAYRARAGYDAQHPFAAWVFRILINTCYDRLRARRAVASELPLNLAARRDQPALRVALERAIERLGERERTAFLLFAVEGFQHKEIAGIMEAPESTVRWWVAEARRALQEMLAPREAAG